MQERGKPHPKRDAEAAEAVLGDFTISFTQSEQYGRMTMIASFHRAGAADAPPLPPLNHVELSWMGMSFVLTGIEFVEDVAYGQSWWCRTP